jgi:signal transduction histidine kinase
MTKEKEFSELLCEIVAHDMANGLTTLGSYSVLLDEELDEKQVKAKKYSKINLVTIEKLIALMEFFRKYRADCQKISWRSLGSIYKYRKVASSVKIIANDELGTIKIYASDLASMVFDNLIDNTIRHSKATEIRVSYCFNSDSELVVVFEDDGKRVLVENKEKIFEKGFGENTGMGLYLTRKILDITDIKIVEVGEPGKGARFEIIIPKNCYKIETINAT